MAGMMKRLCVLLGLTLLAVACGAKKLWGVDVGNKEDKGEFESLLQKAGQDTGAVGVRDDMGEVIDALANMDLSQLSLSELCTSTIDFIIEVVQDEEWMTQFAEPGMIGGLLENSGMGALLGEGGMASVEKDDLVELLALEGSPILYKTKFYELLEKTVGKLIKLRMDVADPAKLRAMIRDFLKTSGLEREQINQVLEIVDNPELLSQQMKALLSDPMVLQELKKAADTLTGVASMLEDGTVDDDEVVQLLAALEDDPERLEEVYNELMKDPAFAEAMMAEGGGAGGMGNFFQGAGGRPGGQAQRNEL